MYFVVEWQLLLLPGAVERRGQVLQPGVHFPRYLHIDMLKVYLLLVQLCIMWGLLIALRRLVLGE